MKFRLVDHGYPFKKIMTGKKWVGRVFQHADGTWRGQIGKTELSKADNPEAAFRQAVAKELGYSSVEALHSHNRQVRRWRSEQRSHAKYILGEIMNGNFNPLDELFKKGESSE